MKGVEKWEIHGEFDTICVVEKNECEIPGRIRVGASGKNSGIFPGNFSSFDGSFHEISHRLFPTPFMYPYIYMNVFLKIHLIFY